MILMIIRTILIIMIKHVCIMCIYIYMIDGDIKIVCVQVLTKVSACTDVSGSITVSEPNNV